MCLCPFRVETGHVKICTCKITKNMSFLLPEPNNLFQYEMNTPCIFQLYVGWKVPKEVKIWIPVPRHSYVLCNNCNISKWFFFLLKCYAVLEISSQARYSYLFIWLLTLIPLFEWMDI